jgi:hypothetical protein
MSDLSEKTIESLAWKSDLKNTLNRYYKDLIGLYPEYKDDFVFKINNLDKVFDFYKENCYHQLKNLLPDKENGKLDRHKIIAAYMISFLVKNNEIFTINWENHHGEDLPLPLTAAIEIFLVDFARSFLREFILMETQETGFTGRSKIAGYDIILPDVETPYMINNESHISKFYDNYVKLMIMLRRGLSEFKGKKINEYPLMPTILLLANDLYLLEAVSDCGKFNRKDLYYTNIKNAKL